MSEKIKFHDKHSQSPILSVSAGVDLEGRCRGCATPPPPFWEEAFFFIFTFRICLPHHSVIPLLSGAPPPKKNPGSASGLSVWAFHFKTFKEIMILNQEIHWKDVVYRRMTPGQIYLPSQMPFCFCRNTSDNKKIHFCKKKKRKKKRKQQR